MAITPIQTDYKGYKFRSRLEARWAVFFDLLDIEFEYEKEGFNLEGTGYYLPDFFLSQWNSFVEIKPPGYPSDSARLKCRLLAQLHPVSIFDGDPYGLIVEEGEFYTWDIDYDENLNPSVTITSNPGAWLPFMYCTRYKQETWKQIGKFGAMKGSIIDWSDKPEYRYINVAATEFINACVTARSYRF